MFKSKYILILGIIILLFACDNLDISSNQADSFIKFYGSWSIDKGKDVKQFGDGYIILATVTSGSDNTEILLLQTDRMGNLKIDGLDTLSSVRGGNNSASKLLLTADGGFIVIGTVEDTLNDNTDIYINKFSSTVTSDWEKFIGTNSNEVGGAIKKAYSGYIIAGSTDAEDLSISNNKGSKDIYLVKIDDAGNIEWAENQGGSGDEYSSDIITINNGYMVVGTTNSFGEDNNNIIIVKTNLNGGAPDMMTYGADNNDYGASIVKAADGGYLIVGTVENVAGDNPDVYVVKVEDDIHSIIWDKQYARDVPAQGFDIIRSNGGYIIVGSKELPSGPAAYFLKIDSEGVVLVGNPGDEVLNGITYGGYGQILYSIEPTYDGGYIMTGSSGVEGNEMICLIKVNSEGEL